MSDRQEPLPNAKQRLVLTWRSVWHWFSDDGRYFCLSTLLHAILLLSLGLIQWRVVSQIADDHGRDIASFTPADVDRGEPPEVVHFERGKAQLDPSVLNEQTLEMFKDLPVGIESGERDLKPEDIGAGGGGTPDGVANLISSFTGAVRGSSPNGPGSPYGSRTPGGLGTGKNPGSGGNTVGFGHGRAQWGVTGPSERAVAAALNWIARHQTPGGFWSLDHRKACKGIACSGGGNVQVRHRRHRHGDLAVLGRRPDA